MRRPRVLSVTLAALLAITGCQANAATQTAGRATWRATKPSVTATGPYQLYGNSRVETALGITQTISGTATVAYATEAQFFNAIETANAAVFQAATAEARATDALTRATALEAQAREALAKAQAAGSAADEATAKAELAKTQANASAFAAVAAEARAATAASQAALVEAKAQQALDRAVTAGNDAARASAAAALADAKAASAAAAAMAAEAKAQQALNVANAAAAAIAHFNVKTYGAKGDNDTDDTAAVQRAIATMGATGGVLVFPAGTYVVGNFQYPDTLVFSGMPGAKFRVGGQLIDIPRDNETTGPLELHVSPMGSPTNHGLSSACPLDKPSSALRRLPRNIYHETVINVGEGVYTEGGMLDEYARPSGLVLDGLIVHPSRISPSSSYPVARPWRPNWKGAKLSIIGAGSGRVTLQGRPDGVPYQEGLHPRSGIISRIRDIYLYGLTIKNYDVNMLAHESGAISGWDIHLRNSGNTGLLVESQLAKVELGGASIEANGSYCVYVLDGELDLNNGSRLLVGTAGPGILATHSSVHFDGQIASSDGVTLRQGVQAINSEVTLKGDFDRVSFLNEGGTMNFIGSTIKNAAVGVTNRGGSLAITGGSHLFDNQVGVLLQGGHLSIQRCDSLDGTAQKYNTVAGVKVQQGYYRYSPYDVTILGNQLRGASGMPETNVVFDYGTRYPIESQRESISVFSYGVAAAPGLAADLNALLSKAKAPADPLQGSTLFAAWNGLTPLSSFQVADCNAKLNELATAMANAGLVADASKYINNASANTPEDHERVRLMFNILVADLAKYGLMKPGGAGTVYDLIRGADGNRYVVYVDATGTLRTVQI